jgi:hypothetical protein
LERGSKAGMMGKSLVFGLSFFSCLKRGKWTREWPTRPFFPFPAPWIGGEEAEDVNLSDFLVRTRL